MKLEITERKRLECIISGAYVYSAYRKMIGDLLEALLRHSFFDAIRTLENSLHENPIMRWWILICSGTCA